MVHPLFKKEYPIRESEYDFTPLFSLLLLRHCRGAPCIEHNQEMEPGFGVTIQSFNHYPTLTPLCRVWLLIRNL